MALILFLVILSFLPFWPACQGVSAGEWLPRGDESLKGWTWLPSKPSPLHFRGGFLLLKGQPQKLPHEADSSAPLSHRLVHDLPDEDFQVTLFTDRGPSTAAGDLAIYLYRDQRHHFGLVIRKMGTAGRGVYSVLCDDQWIQKSNTVHLALHDVELRLTRKGSIVTAACKKDSDKTYTPLGRLRIPGGQGKLKLAILTANVPAGQSVWFPLYSLDVQLLATPPQSVEPPPAD